MSVYCTKTLVFPFHVFSLSVRVDCHFAAYSLCSRRNEMHGHCPIVIRLLQISSAIIIRFFLLQFQRES